MCSDRRCRESGVPTSSANESSAFAVVRAGNEALANGAWQKGFECFQRAVDTEELPEALEGLATAAWWLDDVSTLFPAREHAYRLYRQAGDRLGAARMAVGLGLDHYVFRGDLASADGWMQLAHRLIDDHAPSPERGWLLLWEAHIALLERSDVAFAKQACSEIAVLARSLGVTDLEILALALSGLSLVNEGQVVDGMRQLDEATTAALAGEVSDVDTIVTVCCYHIYACEHVRDVPRAIAWCERVEEVSRRWSYRSMFAFCRCHYAAVLIWKGDWTGAERELTMATHNLMSLRPGWVPESIMRLAELRRRQGRLEESAALFAQCSAHPHALLGMAELALDRDDVAAARDLVERFLRRVPKDARIERVAGIDLAVRALVAQGDVRGAKDAVKELEVTASIVGTGLLRGTESLAHGIVLGASGELDGARRCFEDAVDLFQQHHTPFESARARMALARVQFVSGRLPAAEHEAREAHDTFRQLGAVQELRLAAPLLSDLGIVSAPYDEGNGGSVPLTRRETEVLQMIANGSSNRQIAEDLFISVRTVERHISSIYDKIGAKGPSARALATVYAFEHGLAQVSRA